MIDRFAVVGIITGPAAKIWKKYPKNLNAIRLTAGYTHR
jgi:hypothetical protein